MKVILLTVLALSLNACVTVGQKKVSKDECEARGGIAWSHVTSDHPQMTCYLPDPKS